MFRPELRRVKRLYLLPLIVEQVGDRDCFSARQIAHAVYYGCGGLNKRQVAAVGLQLDYFVAIGLLVRDDQVAACPLYHCRQRRTPDPDAMVTYTLLHIRFPDWPEQNVPHMIHALEDLDRFIPRHADPGDFLPNGRLPVPPHPWADYNRYPYPESGRRRRRASAKSD